MIVSFEFVWKYNIYCVKSKTLYILWVGLSMYGNSVYWMSHCFCPACWLEQISQLGCCTPTGFFTQIHIWSNFCSCSYLPQPVFSIYIAIGVTFLFCCCYSYMTCFIFFYFGVFLLTISYLPQLKSFLVFMDRSKFFLFQILLQFHLICFYFRWSIFSIFQILPQFTSSVFISAGV